MYIPVTPHHTLTNVIEWISGVNTTTVNENFFTTWMFVNVLGNVVNFTVDDHPKVIFGVVLLDFFECVDSGHSVGIYLGVLFLLLNWNSVAA
ncbi:hypothetical protein WICPIJ_004029 [Wickerhamomyces pijperi]|uniref:Uncharacterized protein n=1 Tax=Wickerhamomyces pijperi TaxID=599730 RepID=A0A9P8Q6Q1_WICPI|nr:hypothetical protein WICPIJ_004029 [Wickerhamomyces pijperi]